MNLALSIGIKNRTKFINKVKPFIIQAIIMSTVVGMYVISTPTANLSYFVLAGYALIGRKQAILALSTSWLLTMINPGIAAEVSIASVGRYIVLSAAAVSVFSRSTLLRRSEIVVNPIILATLLLGLFFVTHSLFFSPMVDVSIMKAVSWTVVMVTLISAWLGLTPDERDLLSRQIFSGLILVMLASIPLIALPVGYLRNNMGFQGVLNHPQVFGITMAILASWAASHILGQKKPPWSSVGLLITSLSMIVLSEARVAGIGLIIGVSIAFFSVPVLSGYSIREVLPGLRSKRVLILFVMASLCIVFIGPVLAERIDTYIVKRGRAENLIEAYNLSRGKLIEKMWINIKQNPIDGIGFGIASFKEYMVVEREPVLGLPVSAPVEKGVLPLAILEETGLIGLALVSIWLFMLLKRSARGGVVPLAVSSTILLLNMGESTLFSPGGAGMLSLVLLGWTFACGRKERN